MTNRVAILFSGGTDSTVVAAQAAQHFNEIHLLSFTRLGIYKMNNVQRVITILEKKFPRTRFIPQLIDIDQIYAQLSYQSYCKNLLKHRFMNLATCGICKLAMHVQTINYCLKHSISQVMDGANHSMDIYPAQMTEVISEISALYLAYGITHSCPVYYFDNEENTSFVEQKINRSKHKHGLGQSTSELLYNWGLASERYLKGSPEDRKRQGRCFQNMILHLYVKKLFLPFSTYEKYKARCLVFMKDKIKYAKNSLIRDT